MVNFGHLRFMQYSVQIGNSRVDKVAIFNVEKLSEQDAGNAIANDAAHPYLMVVPQQLFDRIFLNDGAAIIPDEDPTEPDETPDCSLKPNAPQH